MSSGRLRSIYRGCAVASILREGSSILVHKIDNRQEGFVTFKFPTVGKNRPGKGRLDTAPKPKEKPPSQSAPIPFKKGISLESG